MAYCNQPCVTYQVLWIALLMLTPTFCRKVRKSQCLFSGYNMLKWSKIYIKTGASLRKMRASSYCIYSIKSYFARNVRLSSATGSSPTSTSASAGNAASPNLSSRASW